MSDLYKRQFRKKHGKMTDYELEEYHNFADNGFENYYWKNKLTKMIIKSVGLLAIGTHCLLATKISWLVIAGIFIAAAIVNSLLKYEVIFEEEMEGDSHGA